MMSKFGFLCLMCCFMCLRLSAQQIEPHIRIIEANGEAVDRILTADSAFVGSAPVVAKFVANPSGNEGRTSLYEWRIVRKDSSTPSVVRYDEDVDFTFTMDAETKKVMVPAQFTGYTHSSYGDVFVGEANEVGKEEWGAPDSFYDPETLTFNFSVAYFVSAGYFGYGVETFKLTPAQARRLGLDKKHMPNVNKSLKVSSRKTHARNGAIMSREQVAD